MCIQALLLTIGVILGVVVFPYIIGRIQTRYLNSSLILVFCNDYTDYWLSGIITIGIFVLIVLSIYLLILLYFCFSIFFCN